MTRRQSTEHASGEGFNPGRREFGRLALRSALGATALLGTSVKRSSAKDEKPAGIKLCAQSSASPSRDQLLFLNQIGAEYVSVASTADLRNADGYLQIKKRYQDAGITVWNIGNSDVHNMPEVTLNLPGRDRKIEQYKQYLRDLGKAGINYTTYAHMGNGIWSSGRSNIRGASAREFDLSSPNRKGSWAGQTWREPLSHGRVFTPEEIWDNYTHFIKQVASVAEEVGVRIGIHPDDPPVPVLAGVPRCVFSSFDGYKRALEIANSPNVGICLCCGTWLEGGRKQTGKDPEEMIRHFGAQKIWKIHFRNVSAPLPHFVETFMDNGYYDMYKIMKSGSATSIFRRDCDSRPQSVNDRRQLRPDGWPQWIRLHAGPVESRGNAERLAEGAAVGSDTKSAFNWEADQPILPHGNGPRG